MAGAASPFLFGPSSRKSSAWSKMVNGNWSASGLGDAQSKYNWNGRSVFENKAELDKFAGELQSSIRRNSNKDVCDISRGVMRWGGVDNKHRQKRTFAWIELNSDEIVKKLTESVSSIKEESTSLNAFDGSNLIMNSTMTKIVSLADPEQRIVIYDGRVGSALGFFVARFAEERDLEQHDIVDQLLFAVDPQPKRNPSTRRIRFPRLFGKDRDRCHATMVRWATRVIGQVAKDCDVDPRKIEAGLFMWDYDVSAEPPPLL
jgi:hypothetical protein